CGLGPEDDGCGFTVDRVRSMPPFDLEDCLRYFAEVRSDALAILGRLTSADLDRSPVGLPDDRTTTGRLLSHYLIEQAQHLGQIAYVRGLQRGLEHTTSWNNPETPVPSKSG
ncbi:MAG: DinB family protein, partial [Actinomycetota bacterium]